MTSIDVEGFHRSGGYAVLTNGEVVNITSWFDDDGDECGAFDYPKTAVAGPDDRGDWWSLDLTEFDPVKTQ